MPRRRTIEQTGFNALQYLRLLQKRVDFSAVSSKMLAVVWGTIYDTEVRVFGELRRACSEFRQKIEEELLRRAKTRELSDKEIEGLVHALGVMAARHYLRTLPESLGEGGALTPERKRKMWAELDKLGAETDNALKQGEAAAGTAPPAGQD